MRSDFSVSALLADAPLPGGAHPAATGTVSCDAVSVRNVSRE